MIGQHLMSEGEMRDAAGPSAQLLHAIVENIPHMVFVKDADTLRFVLFNRAGENLLGMPRHELLGKSDRDFFPAEQADFFVGKDREVLRSGKPLDIPEEEILSPSLGVRVLHTRKVPILDGEGRPRYLLGISEDITEFKAAERRAEDALRATADQEAYYRSLMENASDLVTILERDGTIRDVSPSLTRMLGYQPRERIGRKVFEMIHPDDLPVVEARLAEALADSATVTRVEFRLHHRDGSWRRVESTGANLLAEPAVRGIVVNTRDVTEARSLEAQLRQAQKMEAVGQLAGGVAHDFNNILTVIDANAAFLLEELAPTDPRHDEAREIKEAAERATALTRQLLAFSRRQVLQPRVLDLHVVVGDLHKMLRRLIGEDVELQTNVAPDVSRVFADPGQVEQLLLNLTVNARDAMPTGGKLTIEARNVTLDATYVAAYEDLEPGAYAVIAVSDTGEGMDKETQVRIFEPFFTTKGHGTGLGLATVYGIVKQSRGHIKVYSEPGLGTTFKIYLPASDEQAGPHPTGEFPIPRVGAGETVLLVEDEPGVRAVARRVLEDHGYTVLEAPNGAVALRLVEAYEGRLEILVTDVIMPGMSGRELAEKLTARRPDLHVLYVSGYTDDAIAHAGILSPGTFLLEKPFTPYALLRKVHHVLSAPARAPGSADDGPPVEDAPDS